MSQSKEVQVVFQGLESVPNMLTEIRGGVLALKALLSAPRAATATGSPFMAAAVVALGIELAVFVFQTIEAIDEDIDAKRKTHERYQETDDEAKRSAEQIEYAQLAQCTGAVAPGAAAKVVAR